MIISGELLTPMNLNKDSEKMYQNEEFYLANGLKLSSNRFQKCQVDINGPYLHRRNEMIMITKQNIQKNSAESAVNILENRMYGARNVYKNEKQEWIKQQMIRDL